MKKMIIATTHTDNHGCRLSKEYLEGMQSKLNGERKARLEIEHITTLPPFGIVRNVELVEREDGHYYLTAEQVCFDKQEKISLEDGTILLKESFNEGAFPFIECADGEVDKLSIAMDSINFDSDRDISDICELVKQESGLGFEKQRMIRKSELPDPEVVITITKAISITLGLIATKIPEKVGDAVGDDVAKFYKLISRLVIETLKKAKPSNRPKSFVISYPNAECNIELVITTHNQDAVLNSLVKEKLQTTAGKVEILEKLNPEKIQFIYNNNSGMWEYNYLLAKDGSVVGTEKTFKNRNEQYLRSLELQNERLERNKPTE